MIKPYDDEGYETEMCRNCGSTENLGWANEDGVFKECLKGQGCMATKPNINRCIDRAIEALKFIDAQYESALSQITVKKMVGGLPRPERIELEISENNTKIQHKQYKQVLADLKAFKDAVPEGLSDGVKMVEDISINDPWLKAAQLLSKAIGGDDE